MNRKFNVGDCVNLNGDDYLMVVNRIIAENKVECVYHDKNLRVIKQIFDEDALMLDYSKQEDTTNKSFNVGDEVNLNGHDCHMVVNRIIVDNKVECVYHDKNGNFIKQIFEEGTLMLDYSKQEDTTNKSFNVGDEVMLNGSKNLNFSVQSLKGDYENEMLCFFFKDKQIYSINIDALELS